MKPFFIKLFQYDLWANLLMIQAMFKTSPINERAKAKMTHILGAHQIWLQRITGAVADNSLFQTQDDFEVCAKKFCEKIIDYLNTIDDLELKKILEYRNMKGEPSRSNLEDILVQLGTHGVYHRGQIATALKQSGLEPPATDFIVYTRQLNK